MNPNIQQWAQTPEAQPYLQARGIGAQPQQGGYGVGGGNDQYISLLKQMYDSNAGNPKAQNAYVNEYLNILNPANQPDPLEQQYQFLRNEALNQQINGYRNENISNLALSLISSQDPDLMGYGINMLKSLYPEYIDNSQTVIEKSPYDIVREGAANRYGGMANTGVTSTDQLGWQKYLSEASDENIDKYNQKSTFGEMINDYRGDNRFERGVANTLLFGIPGFADMLSSEDVKKKRAGYGI